MADDPRTARRLTQEEFACLVERHQHRLHVYLAGLLGSAEGAFDLVQETFYAAWRAAQQGTPPFVPGAAEDDVRRWLFRAGSNDAISALRRRRLIRWESLDAADAAREASLATPDTSTLAAGFEDRLAEGDVLRAALAALAPQDVACLLLRVVHGFSAAEAGAILNTSADNINNRLARAKQRLRAAYISQSEQRGERQERTSR
jgi:RNA polymerase sigma-70 factor, ECF subfamily